MIPEHGLNKNLPQDMSYKMKNKKYVDQIHCIHVLRIQVLVCIEVMFIHSL